jgi:hypothetical protein
MATVIPLAQTLNWAKRRNLPPVRQRNRTSRSREHLTPDEVERMILAARQAGGRSAAEAETGRHGFFHTTHRLPRGTPHGTQRDLNLGETD